MTFYKIPEPLLQEVVNYLATKPFQEVANLIQALVKLDKFPEITQDAPVKIQEPSS